MKHRYSAGGAKRMAIGLGILAILLPAVVLFGYNAFQDNLGTVQSPVPVVARWASMPFEWYLNPSVPDNNVTGCTTSLTTCIQQVLTDGYATWTHAQVPIAGVPQTLTDLTVNYAGLSTATAPDASDCQNVIGFSDTNSSNFSTGTIAFTAVATVTQPAGTTGPFTYNCSGGVTKTCNLVDCMADADIEFNPKITFSAATTPPSDTNTFSLQAVATHEEGHSLGLDHSGIAHAVMFPFGDTTSSGQELTLSTDDAIAISYLYPCTSITGNCTGDFEKDTGVISGTVTLNGAGVFAAHVVVVNASTGNVVTDRLTNPDGTYKLEGVPPGNYKVLALPLSLNFNTGILTLGDFSGWSCGYADSTCTTVPQNPTSYTGRYH